MGSSAKRKKEKKKDFQKPQLKVGKTKPKATNFTDTSFKAKSIVVNKQSISVAAPTAYAQFTHHVSFLKNRSDSQRAESLAFLTSVIGNTPTNESLPEPLAELLPRMLPLVLDGSGAVRQQLLRLLHVLGKRAGGIRGHSERILLYVHAGMSHLSADIRGFAVEVLDWLLRCAALETVACAGGWTRTLDCFLSLFGWRQREVQTEGVAHHKGWSSVHKTNTRPGSDSKAMSRQLSTFAKFLIAGTGKPVQETASEAELSGFPVRHLRQHLVSVSGNSFAHLNLFGSPRDDQGEMLEDREDRQRVFERQYRQAVSEGSETLIKEGGEIGRAAAGVKKATAEGQRDFEAGDDHVLN